MEKTWNAYRPLGKCPVGRPRGEVNIKMDYCKVVF
jgi:hypothetical protein